MYIHNDIDISIIIPNYNRSSKLKKCIKSCFRQGLDENNFEVIVVDDKSTDNSIEVLERLKKKYDIRLNAQTENKGIENSRFEGLKMARGRYVCFIDNDDWYADNTLSKVLKIALNGNYDVVEFQAKKVLTLFGIPIFSHYLKQTFHGEMEFDSLDNDYYLSFFGGNSPSLFVTHKLYSRDVLKKANVQRSNTRYGEDVYFNMAVFPYVKRIFVSSICGYNYRYGGITSNIYPFFIEDIIKNFYLQMGYVQKYNLSYEFEYISAGLIKNLFRQYVINLLQNRKYTNKQIIKEIERYMSHPVWDRIFNEENRHRFKDPEFTKAMISKNPELIISVCQQRIKEIPLSIKFKSSIVDFINKRQWN